MFDFFKKKSAPTHNPEAVLREWIGAYTRREVYIPDGDFKRIDVLELGGSDALNFVPEEIGYLEGLKVLSLPDFVAF